MPVKEVRSWPLEDQYRHIIALGKIGELMRQVIDDRGNAIGNSSGNKIRIVRRDGRLVKVD